MGKSQAEGFVEQVVAILVRERKRQGISHERLAEAAGVHRSTVSRTERGLMSPTLLVVYKLATALGLSFPEIAAEAQENNRRKRT